MDITKLSSKGQVIIPKTPFLKSNLDTVASCLKFSGKAKTLKEMDNAIKKGIKNNFK
ncbi:MAG: hypothetical protein ACC653_11310 [Gammaproteobacteria bacterium]